MVTDVGITSKVCGQDRETGVGGWEALRPNWDANPANLSHPRTICGAGEVSGGGLRCGGTAAGANPSPLAAPLSPVLSPRLIKRICTHHQHCAGQSTVQETAAGKRLGEDKRWLNIGEGGLRSRVSRSTMSAGWPAHNAGGWLTMSGPGWRVD